MISATVLIDIDEPSYMSTASLPGPSPVRIARALSLAVCRSWMVAEVDESCCCPSVGNKAFILVEHAWASSVMCFTSSASFDF